MGLLSFENKIRPCSTTIFVFEIFPMIVVLPLRRMAVFQVLQNRNGSIFNTNWSTIKSFHLLLVHFPERHIHAKRIIRFFYINFYVFNSKNLFLFSYPGAGKLLFQMSR